MNFFVLFHPSVKIRGGMDKRSESILQVQRKTLMYFWWETAAQAWREELMNLKFQYWAPNQTTVLSGEWAELHQILGVHRTIIDAPQVCVHFRYVASFWN